MPPSTWESAARMAKVLPKWRKPTSFIMPAPFRTENLLETTHSVPTVHIYIENAPPEPDHPPPRPSKLGKVVKKKAARQRPSKLGKLVKKKDARQRPSKHGRMIKKKRAPAAAKAQLAAGCGQFLTWLGQRSRAPDDVYSRLCEMTDAAIFDLKSIYMY